MSEMTEEQIIERALTIIDSRWRVCDGEPLTDPGKAGDLFKLHLGQQPREVFACMFLTTRHQLIAYEELFFGGIDGAEVHPRVVVQQALKHNAAAVLLGHNHPSGNPEPSAADRAVTARIKQALNLVDIRLLDHFVVGRDAPVSMAAKGWV